MLIHLTAIHHQVDGWETVGMTSGKQCPSALSQSLSGEFFFFLSSSSSSSSLVDVLHVIAEFKVMIHDDHSDECTAEEEEVKRFVTDPFSGRTYMYAFELYSACDLRGEKWCCRWQDSREEDGEKKANQNEDGPPTEKQGSFPGPFP